MMVFWGLSWGTPILGNYHFRHLSFSMTSIRPFPLHRHMYIANAYCASLWCKEMEVLAGSSLHLLCFILPSEDMPHGSPKVMAARADLRKQNTPPKAEQGTKPMPWSQSLELTRLSPCRGLPKSGEDMKPGKLEAKPCILMSEAKRVRVSWICPTAVLDSTGT